jgi:hypothetical protein
MRWVWRGTALGALLIGWLFITWQNHFHITAPVVFVCLAYLAVVTTVYNLWRTGAAAVSAGDDGADSTWAKPTGALGELEREKRTLLKAIKEAEFDHQMGKLSQRDADDMIRMYRARAIEVIKEIDQLGLGGVGTPREQIMREVRARLELDARAQKKTADPKRHATEATADSGAKGKTKKQLAKEAARAGAASAGPGATPEQARSATGAAADEEANHAAPDARAAAEAASEPATEAPSPAATGAASLDDDAMDADSTTTVESTRNHRAKEATP